MSEETVSITVLMEVKPLRARSGVMGFEHNIIDAIPTLFASVGN